MKTRSWLFVCAVFVLSQGFDDLAAKTISETELQAFDKTVRSALDSFPKAEQAVLVNYIDPQNGRFNYAGARMVLGAVKASTLRLEWEQALSKARIRDD